jgi:hypothetical protein
MAEIQDATHCISCGNELSDDELNVCAGHCSQCIEEACEDYWESSRKEYSEE